MINGEKRKSAPKGRFQRETNPRIRPQLCAPVLVLPRIQGFSITLKRRQRAKIKIILALSV
ncbi:hypothetical protein C6W18_08040 [Bacillus sp. LLTC93]|nr:hypothetical protein C6W18_08040 [Bacillus sp. LLTC93]